MAMNLMSIAEKQKCDYFIEAPGIGEMRVFDIKKLHELFKWALERREVIEENPSLQGIRKQTPPIQHYD